MGLRPGRRWESSLGFFSPHGCQLPQRLLKPRRSALPKSTEERERALRRRKQTWERVPADRDGAPCPKPGIPPGGRSSSGEGSYPPQSPSKLKGAASSPLTWAEHRLFPPLPCPAAGSAGPARCGEARATTRLRLGHSHQPLPTTSCPKPLPTPLQPDESPSSLPAAHSGVMGTSGDKGGRFGGLG